MCGHLTKTMSTGVSQREAPRSVSRIGYSLLVETSRDLTEAFETWTLRSLFNEPEGNPCTADHRNGEGKHRTEASPVKHRTHPQTDEGDHKDDDTDANRPFPLVREKRVGS